MFALLGMRNIVLTPLSAGAQRSAEENHKSNVAPIGGPNWPLRRIARHDAIEWIRRKQFTSL